MKDKARLIMLIVLAAAFGFGLLHLLTLRFQTGDVLPVYSSLRSDPLGAKAWHDSLDHLGTVKVSRYYQPLDRLEASPGATVLFLGLPAGRLIWAGRDLWKELDRIMTSGGRLVIAFRPTAGKFEIEAPEDEKADEAKKDEDATGKKDRLEKPEKEQSSRKDGPSPDRTESADRNKARKPESKKKPPGDLAKLGRTLRKWISIERHWGLKIAHDPKWSLKKKYQAGPASGHGPVVSWHSSLYFEDLSKPWRVLYRRDGRPVIIERRFGSGSVVLMSDSYHFSNEALRAEPRAELLSRLIGPVTEVVFDEAHLGLQEDLGVAGLGRKYGLHGLLAGLLVLAVLFIWKNSFSLVPADDDAPGGRMVYASPRDYTAGLVSLLRRNVSSREILEVCWREWKAAQESLRRDWGPYINRAEAVAGRKSRAGGPADPVEGYLEIHQILSEGKKTWNRARTT
ncbi:MAG: DUF4350 domain-containing protein [Thermodesulfobacteriota bacterium]